MHVNQMYNAITKLNTIFIYFYITIAVFINILFIESINIITFLRNDFVGV